MSVDRVIGFHAWNYEFDQDGPNSVKEDHSGTMLNFLGANATAASGSWRPINASAVPRVGADLLFGIATVGATISYVATSGESEQRANGVATTTTDDPDVSLFLFGVRGGMLFPWTPVVSLWPRAGLYRAAYSEEGDFGEFTASETVISLDPVVVVSPVPHLAFTVGPVVDFSVTGEAEFDQSQADLDGDGVADGAAAVKGDLGTNDFGIVAGIAGVF